MSKYEDMSKEELLAQIGQKLNQVKEVEGEPEQELQWDKLVKDATEEIDALVEKRVQDKLDSQPVYRQPGAEIAVAENLEALKGTRYYRMVKDINRDGYFKSGNKKIKQQDLWLAHYYMQ